MRALGDALGGSGGRGGRYLYISSVSAYAPGAQPPITESSPLAVLADEDTEVVDGESYGGLKALCEYAAVEAFGPETLIVRPTYVVGPYDPTAGTRTGCAGSPRAARCWPSGRGSSRCRWSTGATWAPSWCACSRAAPADRSTWRARRRRTRWRTCSTPRPAAVAPEGTTITWVTPEFATAHTLDGRVVPLWHEGELDPVAAVDPSAALRAGLALRPVGDTARDVLAAGDATPLADGVGLSRDRERELLEAARHDRA